MPNIGLACPTCDAQGKTSNLVSQPFRQGVFCETGLHKFEVDSETLAGLNLRKIPITMSVQKRPGKFLPLTIQLPEKLTEAVNAKFKDRVDISLEAVLAAMLDPDSFVVTGFDVSKLKNPEFLGQKVTNINGLTGEIFRLRNERDEARREAESYKLNKGAVAGNGTAVDVNEIPGDYVQMSLRISVEHFMAIKEKAKFNGKIPAVYIMEVLVAGLENGWF